MPQGTFDHKENVRSSYKIVYNKIYKIEKKEHAIVESRRALVSINTSDEKKIGFRWNTLLRRFLYCILKRKEG